MSETAAAFASPRNFALRSKGSGCGPFCREPTPLDGPSITKLIAACPPLDTNSAYCNLLQCVHFAQTCVVAEQDSRIIGWISGYRPPSNPDDLFVWQVAVDVSVRGQGLAGRMIETLLARPAAQGATHLVTTVTSDNRSSWALFEGLARRLDAPLEKRALFERDTHFTGAHATEWQARIGPLPARVEQEPSQETS